MAGEKLKMRMAYLARSGGYMVATMIKNGEAGDDDEDCALLLRVTARGGDW
jgi:hypothetical protein